jgi:hypothetical protein
MGQCHEIFALGFFHESFSPKPPNITLGSLFQIFQKFAEIFTKEGAPQVSTTPVANLPPASTTLAANFAPGTAGDVDTGTKLPLVSRILAANNGNKARL